MNTTAQSFNSFVSGTYNIVRGTTDTWIPTDDLFIVGNGSGYGVASNNAVTVLKNGTTYIGDATPIADPILTVNPIDSITTIIGNLSVTDTADIKHLAVTDSATLEDALFGLYHLTPTSDSLVVADDGFINLPAGVYGTLDVTSFNSGSWDAYAYAKINSDGSVFLVYNSTENVSTTGGTDNHMNIYDAGTYTRIENKLGGNRTIKYTFIH
jgi:hypothetical protein